MTDYILPTELERKGAVLREGMRKLMDNDLDGAVEELRKIQLAAPTLAFFKDSYGADWIRKHNFDTTRADEEYGQNWLDR